MAGSESSKKKWKKKNNKNKTMQGLEAGDSVPELRSVHNSVGAGLEADGTVDGQNKSNQNSNGVQDGGPIPSGKL